MRSRFDTLYGPVRSCPWCGEGPSRIDYGSYHAIACGSKQCAPDDESWTRVVADSSEEALARWDHLRVAYSRETRIIARLRTAVLEDRECTGHSSVLALALCAADLVTVPQLMWCLRYAGVLPHVRERVEAKYRNMQAKLHFANDCI